MSEAVPINAGGLRITSSTPIGIRWVIRPGSDGPERVLQFASQWWSEAGCGVEWQDVPIVDLTNGDTP